MTELRDIEGRVIGFEKLDRECSDSNDSMLLDLTLPPQLGSHDEDQELPIPNSKLEALKVEGPLTPPIFSTSPMRKLKCVSFAETLHEFIPNDQWPATLTDEGSISSTDFDEYFRDLEPLALEAKKKAENERLCESDTIARVEIPEVDFSLPIAPWNEYSQSQGDTKNSGDTELDLQMKFLLRIQHDDLRSATTWHGLMSLERELRWNMFMTNVGTVDINEQLHGETDLKKMFAELSPGTIATSFSQLWKREGLRILDDDEDEDTIDTQQMNDDKAIETLVRKRKSEIEEEAAEVHYHKKPPCRIIPQAKRRLSTNIKTSAGDPSEDRLKVQHSGPRNPKASTTPDNNDLMFGGFSATTALQKFMETRGKVTGVVDTRKDKQYIPRYPSAPTLQTSIDNSNLRVPQTIMTSKNESGGANETNYAEQQPLIWLPDLPDIPADLPPCSFIVSSTLLNRRNLMKQIESLYVEADMVYRDYSLPHSPSQEADFVLSPSTGLIFTTLQQVKQRALPGQPKRAPIKERMHLLCQRYERLIVMIGEGLSREMEDFGSSRPDDHRNTEVLIEFENFASELEGEVLVKYTQGGEQALAHSTLIEMIKYGLPHGSADIGDVKPLAVETSVSIAHRYSCPY